MLEWASFVAFFSNCKKWKPSNGLFKNNGCVIFWNQYKKDILMVKVRIDHWNKNARIVETNAHLNGTENGMWWDWWTKWHHINCTQSIL